MHFPPRLLTLVSTPHKVDARNIDGSTPLCDACASGSIECVKLLLSYGAKVNPPLYTASPLHEACMSGEWQEGAVWTGSGSHQQAKESSLSVGHSWSLPPGDTVLIQDEGAVVSMMGFYFLADCWCLSDVKTGGWSMLPCGPWSSWETRPRHIAKGRCSQRRGIWAWRLREQVRFQLPSKNG